MSRECPDLDELALALSLEFRKVDVTRVTATLDRLASGLGAASPAAPDDQCRRCGALLSGPGRLRTSTETAPSLLMLDEVLDRACGSDLLVVVARLN
jgi:hypothetical protein